MDSNQYGEAGAVAATTWGATFAVEDVFKADEALPVGPVYVTAGANEEVADSTTDEICEMEAWEAATGLIRLVAPSRANAR